MKSIELLSTYYRVITIKLWFLVRWHKHISTDNANIVWLEPTKRRWLAKLLYGTDVLNKEYFLKFGIDLNKTI